MKTVKYEEYNSELEKLEKLLEKRTCIKNIKDYVWFTRRNLKDPLKLFVNFCCLGASDPVVASRFADCIKEAANLAKNFKYNGYIID